MKNLFDLSVLKKQTFKHLYVAIIILIVSFVVGPNSLSQYHGEVFLYERIVTNFSEISGFMIMIATVWILRDLKDTVKSEKLDIKYIVTKLLVVITVGIVPIMIMYRWFLGISVNQHGIGSLSLIITRELSLLVLLVAIALLVFIISLKMATIWETAIYSVLLLILPFFVFSTIEMFLIIFVSGYPVQLKSELLGLFSPLAAMSYINNEGVYKYGIEFFISYWLIFDILGIVLMNKLIGRRIVLTTQGEFGNSKVSQFVTIVFTSTVLLALSMMEYVLYTSGGNILKAQHIIIPLIGTLVVFVLLASLQNRKVMKFKDNFVILGVICVITGILFSLTYFTKGFGIGESIPESDNVSHITMIAVLSKEYDPLSSWDIYPYVRIQDKEMIDKVIKYHEEILKELAINKQSILDSDKEPILLDLTYYLKNGDKVTRTYTLSDELYEELRSLQYNTDTLLQSEPLFENKTQNIRIYNDVFTQSVDATAYLPEIITAYQKDLMNITYENSKQEDNIIRHHIMYTMDTLKYIDDYGEYQIKINETPTPYQIIIDDRFSNTLAVIDSINETPRPVSVKYAMINELNDPQEILLDGRVKRIQDLHIKVSDMISYQTESGDLEQFEGKLINSNNNNKGFNKVLFEGNDGDIKIKSLIPIKRD